MISFEKRPWSTWTHALDGNGVWLEGCRCLDTHLKGIPVKKWNLRGLENEKLRERERIWRNRWKWREEMEDLKNKDEER